MKKNIKKYLLFLGVITLITSCKKDFLNTKPQSQITDVAVWNDPVLVETFINGIYSNVDNPANGGDGVLRGEFVDEMHDQWYSFFEFNNCIITPDNLGNWFHEDWNKIYKNIRACNVFFEKINGVSAFDDKKTDGVLLKNRMVGEVHFLRGYLYHQLVNLYGGVPLIKNSYNLTDNFEIKRDTYADCIKFIVAECDSAANLLPLVESGRNMGRATKGAALTLKSRVVLFAASDLYNTNVFSGFAHPELIGYPAGEDRTAKWQAAKDAAKAVIDLNMYSLYKANPSPADSVAQNYADIFTKGETEEDIWLRYYKFGPQTYAREANQLSLVAGPNGYHLYGEDTPAGEIVDDYEMIDGSAFSWSDPSKSYEPYKNRDPRFYASILYEGAKFKARPIDIQPIDPIGILQVGTWQKWSTTDNAMAEQYGIDSRKGPIESFNGGYTGYYLRKFVNPAVDGQFQQDGTPWRYMRYAEVILNYAEACIELHQDAEARTYLNMIRKRAGMPDITESGNALRDRYRHERRVELAFEEHRFYDVRRWVIGPQAYQQFSGVNVLYKMNPDHSTATVPVITPFVVQESAWLNKAYFFPISRDEMNKNSLLLQNPEY